jgi:acyl-CoA synthetase (AMP-forming)/AMP-acid ligase II
VGINGDYGLKQNFHTRIFSQEGVIWPTMNQVFIESILKYQDQDFLWDYSTGKLRQFTYEEIYSSAIKLEAYLNKTLKQQKRLCLLVGYDSAEWAITLLGLLVGGYPVVILSPDGLNQEKVSQAIKEFSPAMLFCTHALNEQYNWQDLKHISLDYNTPHYLFDFLEEKPNQATYIHPSDIALIMPIEKENETLYTMISHQNLTSQILLTSQRVTFRETDYISCADSFISKNVWVKIHNIIFTLFLPMLTGAKTIVANNSFTTNQKHNTTIFLGSTNSIKSFYRGIFVLFIKNRKRVGSYRFLLKTLQHLYKYAKHSLSMQLCLYFLKKALKIQNVRLCIGIGENLPTSIANFFWKSRIEYWHGISCAETTGVFTLSAYTPKKYLSEMSVLEHVELEMVYQLRQLSGLITIKAPFVFEGYYNNFTATSNVFTNSGYYKTGYEGKVVDKNILTHIEVSLPMIMDEETSIYISETMHAINNMYQQPSIDYVFISPYYNETKTKVTGFHVFIYPNLVYFYEKTLEYMIENLIKLTLKINKKISYLKIDTIEVAYDAMEITSYPNKVTILPEQLCIDIKNMI